MLFVKGMFGNTFKIVKTTLKHIFNHSKSITLRRDSHINQI